MKRLRAWARGLLVAVILLAVGTVVAAGLLARTAPGRSVVLNEVLARARASLNGDIEVASFGGGDLFERASLVGVVVKDARGGVVFTADSLDVGYSIFSLLSGGREASSIDVYGWTLNVVADEHGWNVAQLAAGPGAAASAADSLAALAVDSVAPQLAQPAALRLRNVGLHDGRISVVPVTAAPMHFEGIEAELPLVELGGGIDHVEVFQLAFDGKLAKGPVTVQELVGSVRREGNTLEVRAGRLRLLDSEAEGEYRLSWSDSTGVRSELDLTASRVALRDLAWLSADLPPGRVRGELQGEFGGGGARWTFADADFRGEAGALFGSGTVRMGERLRLDQIRLDVQDFDVRQLSSLVADTSLLWGTWEGPLQLDGTLDRLAIQTEMALRDPETDRPVGRIALDGGLRVGDRPGADSLRLLADSVDYRALGRFGVPTWLERVGQMDLVVDGELRSGLRLVGEVLTTRVAAPSSRVFTDLNLVEASAGLGMSGTLDFTPLRLALLSPLAPALGLQGEARGRVTVDGRVGALTVATDLDTSGGPLNVVAEINSEAEGVTVRVEGELEELDIQALASRFPERTVLNGAAELTAGPQSGDVVATLDLASSTFAGVRVNGARTALHVRDGLLEIDSLGAVSSAGRLEATGSLALAEAREEGEMQVRVTQGSLQGLRPLIFGDEGGLPPELRAAFGDLDADSVDLDGRFELNGVVRGSAQALVGSGRVEVGRGVVRDLEFDTATVEVERFDLASGDLEARIQAGAIRLFDRPFLSASGTVGLQERRGRVVMQLERESGRVFGAGEIAIDSLGTVLQLDQFNVTDNGERWNLGGPARLAWGDQALEVRNLRVLRVGDRGFRLDANGTLPRAGSGQLDVNVTGLDLARISRIVAFEEGNLEGKVDLDLTVTGSLPEPIIEADLRGEALRYRVARFDEIEGALDFSGQTLNGAVFAWSDGHRQVSIEGHMPANLALAAVESRVPDGDVRLTIEADAVPLANVLGFFPGYESVEGELSGDFVVAGTPEDLQPSGTVRLTDGAAYLTEFGVRPEQVQASLELTPDGNIAVDATMWEQGEAHVSGTIALNPINDPGFDLDVETRTNQSVRIAARRDVEARVSGSVNLGGSYLAPVITGTLNVDEGVLYLDEFVRAASIVDLADPGLATLEFDAALIDQRELVNLSPFVQYLRVNVGLSMSSNAWLRSPEMNVEMAGDLRLAFNRRERTLAMLGDLTAIRGTYRVTGRQFDVQEGTVRFLGTPGVNPTLSITATNRLRAAEGAIDITATVDGTMLRPEVHLTSDLPGATREDLISYLLFGRPQGELSQLAGQRGSVLGTAGLSLTLGALASQVGALVADELPFDYLAVSSQQTAGLTTQNALSAGLRGTQVEVGKYVQNDVFLALLLRPFDTREQLSGFRMEWRLSDQVGLEGFVEGRATQLQSSGFDDLLFELRRVVGFRLFREWGY